VRNLETRRIAKTNDEPAAMTSLLPLPILEQCR
jgi:hypothetical protein